jgi:hypothetical protein
LPIGGVSASRTGIGALSSMDLMRSTFISGNPFHDREGARVTIPDCCAREIKIFGIASLSRSVVLVLRFDLASELLFELLNLISEYHFDLLKLISEIHFEFCDFNC